MTTFGTRPYPSAVLLALAALLAGCEKAQTDVTLKYPEAGTIVMSPPIDDCTDYLDSKSQPQLAQAVRFWTNGYLTGVNAYNAAIKSQISSFEGMEPYLKRYCSENPKGRITTGAFLYAQELGARIRRPAAR
ncbi:hypothetical protein WKW79_07710 [Variovorax robiniae]|uniref:Lipoprotein n=1 Tax=Variovorax robiniae TaxID=1836199 RepID=A0ABU8X5P9_9BURK